MNDTLKKAKGKLQEVAGEAMGDEEMRAKGRASQKMVEAKEKMGEMAQDAKQKFAHKANEIMDKMDASESEGDKQDNSHK